MAKNVEYICGIDSGKDGAFVVISISSREIIGKWVMPLTKDRDIDLTTLCSMVSGMTEHKDTLFVLESLQPIYGAGKGSQWSMAQTYGTLIGVLHVLETNYILVPAKQWQKQVILPEDRVLKKSKKGDKMVNDTKASALSAAKRLYPKEKLIYGDNQKQNGRKTKQHEGLVDAVLIARSQLGN